MSFVMGEQSFVVNTKYGPVRGCKRTSIVGEEYLSFRGVPYARPPLGDLRFKDPQPPEPWTTVLDATTPGYCAMANSLTGHTTTRKCSEDCLFVNVYTKKLNPKYLQPVMVWIHGGGFIAGDSSEFLTGPDYLLERDVVFVSFNYRLGALGFLRLDDPDLNVPGNAGLKDQTLALKWVRENIHNFGGDNNNCTVFGNSAGGASVHLHLLSDLSKGLFDKAISQSGNAILTYSYPSKANWAFRLASSMGWNKNGGEREIYDFLKKADAEDIITHQSSIVTKDDMRYGTFIAFGPCVESYKSQQNFLTKAPIELLESAWGNRVPFIIGATSEEGLLYYRYVKHNPKSFMCEEGFRNLLPPEKNPTNESSRNREMVSRMKTFYYQNELSPEPNEENIIKFLDILSDKFFLHGMHLGIKARCQDVMSAATYFYRFNFQTDVNAWRTIFRLPLLRGACHGEELLYLFRSEMVNKPEPDSIEQKLVNFMCDMWTNFAFTGNPNSESLKPLYWDRVRDSPHKCLNISHYITFIDSPEYERMKLWDSFYE